MSSRSGAHRALVPILSLLGVALALEAAEARPPREPLTLYPTPRQATARPDSVPVTPRVGIVAGKRTDRAALRVVEQVLLEAGAASLVYAGDDQPTPDAPLVVWVGGPGENAASASALGALGVAGLGGLGAEGYVAAVGRGRDVVSSTVSSGAVNTKFRDVAVPVATYEAFLFDDMAMATSVGEEWNQSAVNAIAPAHPMGAGRSGSVTVYGVAERLRWGVTGDGADVVLTLPEVPHRAVLFGYEQGAPLVGGRAAPARRAGWFLGDTGVEPLTEDGLALFDASVRWLLGVEPRTTQPLPTDT